MAEEYRLPVQESSRNSLTFNQHTPLGYEMQMLCYESGDFPDLQEDFRNATYECHSLEHESSRYFSQCESSSRNYTKLVDLMQESIHRSNTTTCKEILATGRKWARDMGEKAQNLGSKFAEAYKTLNRLLHNLWMKLPSREKEAQNTAASDNDRCNENVFKHMWRLISKAIHRFIKWFCSLWKTGCCVGSNTSATEDGTSDSEEPEEAEETSTELQGAVDEQMALAKLNVLYKTIKSCQELWERLSNWFQDLYQKFDIIKLQLSLGCSDTMTTQLQSWKKNWHRLGDLFHELYNKSSAEEQVLDEFLNDELPQPLTEEWNKRCEKITAQIQNTETEMRMILRTIGRGA
ncbi:uncharacterized protein LOC122811599 [Protopterus annectens]|uniref:uncharacterized protein LOC122811599 n=1 Tax=Protopterus annectens TaxID=7888 RepID=UPI001CF9DE6D|nr:uncharacterized protein LOC122811599 [Protopterus annectens]